jgi:signal transduction histidine kinase
MPFYEALGYQIGAVLQNARLFEKVSVSRAELQALSHRLIRAQERERRHLARELHDEIGQALTAVKINLESLQRSAGAAWTEPLGDSIDIIKHTLEQVRSLSLDLRPSMLDDFGLVAALRWHLDRQALRAGFRLHFESDPFMKRLPPEIETTCFRVAQEALTNILRHAKASQVNVALRQTEGEMLLTVEDDGVGFDVAFARRAATQNASIGLLGMEERARLAGGWLEITSERHSGTTLRAHFPLPPVSEKSKRPNRRKA